MGKKQERHSRKGGQITGNIHVGLEPLLLKVLNERAGGRTTLRGLQAYLAESGADDLTIRKATALIGRMAPGENKYKAILALSELERILAETGKRKKPKPLGPDEIFFSERQGNPALKEREAHPMEPPARRKDAITKRAMTARKALEKAAGVTKSSRAPLEAFDTFLDMYETGPTQAHRNYAIDSMNHILRIHKIQIQIG